MPDTPLPHAVSRLRTTRLARSSKPFLARGGQHGERCAGCRLVPIAPAR
jgi:DTW domain-containing protein YfiP